MCHQSTHCHPPTPRMTETHWQRGCLGSNSPFGHGSPWMVLFLAVHLFTSCFPLTEAQDGRDDATTGPPDSPAPTSPTKKLPPPSLPLLTTKKVLAALRLTTKKATSSPLVASTWTPGTPFGSAAISKPDGSGYPYAPAISSGSITITMSPQIPQVGGDVTLTPKDEMTGINSCTWFRGNERKSVPIMTYKLPPVSTVENNVSYSGRESISQDCSLHIENLIPSDSGIYTLRTTGNILFEEGKIKVNVTYFIPEEKKEKGLGLGTVAGIVVGALAAVVAVGGLAFFLSKDPGSPTPQPVVPAQPASIPVSRRASHAGRMSRRGSQKLAERKRSISRGRGSVDQGHAK